MKYQSKRIFQSQLEGDVDHWLTCKGYSTPEQIKLSAARRRAERQHSLRMLRSATAPKPSQSKSKPSAKEAAGKPTLTGAASEVTETPSILLARRSAEAQERSCLLASTWKGLAEDSIPSSSAPLPESCRFRLLPAEGVVRSITFGPQEPWARMGCR